jgi:alcohol dehydrogenase/propanol-preferring alcohol dehydrogenase
MARRDQGRISHAGGQTRTSSARGALIAAFARALHPETAVARKKAKTMKAMQVPAPGTPFEMVEREIPLPGPYEVLIKIAACGICHSDAFVREGGWPGIAYPRVPGHEVTGAVEDVGDAVVSWAIGDLVGVGWHGGHCFVCDRCRAGDFVTCRNALVSGISTDGGYAEYMVARQEAVAAVPDGLDLVEAAPLLCAGLTTFNALRNSGARGGDVVAVQGLGGLGHLAVQFATKLGFHTVAISRGQEKELLARELGAKDYIDSEHEVVAEELQKLGGARVILATAPSGRSITTLINGLGVGGRLVVVGAEGTPIEVSPLQLIGARRALSGWPSGQPSDSEDTLEFSALTGAKAMIERFPLAEAEKAYQRMLHNEVRFRAVLDMATSG